MQCQHLVYLSQSTLCSQPSIVYGVETSLPAAEVSRRSAVIRTVVGWGNACFYSLLVVLEKLSWGASTLVAEGEVQSSLPDGGLLLVIAKVF